MKLLNKQEVEEFLETVDQAKDAVYLCSSDGNSYNLKSYFMKYLGIAALIQENAENLDLYCADKTDEPLFLRFFDEHPDTL